jgi:LemA protein
VKQIKEVKKLIFIKKTALFKNLSLKFTSYTCGFSKNINPMKKVLIPIIVIALIGLFVYTKAVGVYNTFVQTEETINGEWAEVETQYQRRADLIPNLVNTVKGYADFEQQTLTGVIEARAKATSITLQADNLTPDNIAKFQDAQDQLSGSLSRLLVAVERYPDLKANQNFLELQAQLEGTENRISVARRNFNQSVQSYNSNLRTFPNNIFAGWYGFERKGYFEAAAGAENAPTVEF